VETLTLFYFNELNSVMDEKLNPWSIINQKTIYENPWINLTEFQVINPSGGTGIYGKVHFKHRAVGVIPLDEKGNIWLVGQYRFTLNQYSWEIPEGGGKMEEDPLEAAKRELLEETGLVAREWTKIMTMHLSNSVSDEIAIIFLARGLDQEQPQPEETEQLQVRKITFEEAVHMVEEEKITDSMSVAAIQKIRLLVYEGKLKIEH
jgi:8-oxo-dGTP pyrophosphatase MutT (NUDIX family)